MSAAVEGQQTTFPVIQDGAYEANRLGHAHEHLLQVQATDDQPPSEMIAVAYYSHVLVGRMRAEYAYSVGGSDAYNMGMRISAHLSDGRCVHSQVLWCHEVWDESVRNKGGGTGAYIPQPPSQERLDAAIATAQEALRAAYGDEAEQEMARAYSIIAELDARESERQQRMETKRQARLQRKGGPGRPRIHDEPRQDVYLRLPVSLVAALDAVTTNRTAYIEAVLREHLTPPTS